MELFDFVLLHLNSLAGISKGSSYKLSMIIILFKTTF